MAAVVTGCRKALVNIEWATPPHLAQMGLVNYDVFWLSEESMEKNLI